MSEKHTKYLSSAILANTNGKPESHMTAMEKMDISQSGVSKESLENFKKKARLDYDKLADILSVSRAVLINKKGKGKFTPALSEKIISIADIYSYGYEIFEDNDRFNSWMSRPNRALGGAAPIDLINNQFGREEVKNIIGRIAYGVYS